MCIRDSLDAAHKGLVTGKDRDDYIESARRKAHDLKEYIDVLYDWFKLNFNVFALEIQSVEAAELTRNILIDWIPIFEDKQVYYDIDIPEQPVRVKLDMDSYMRIITVSYTHLPSWTDWTGSGNTGIPKPTGSVMKMRHLYRHI